MLERELQEVLHRMPHWERERAGRVDELNREITEFAVGPLIGDLQDRYSEVEDAVEHLGPVRRDIVRSVRELAGPPLGAATGSEESPSGPVGPQGMRRYWVNALTNGGAPEVGELSGAPLVYEDNPTYQNLIGRVECVSYMGALVTDFNLIMPGALHRANGGYLILDARKVLLQLHAWEGLKRALKSREIRIESLGLVSTVSLEPALVSLDVMVVLLGEADYWAGRNGNGHIGAAEVQKAIDARIGRSDRLRERLREETLRGTILVDTDGEKLGQINGLSVLQLGDFSFGHPSRITARVRLGKGEVVDIEREVKLGGPFHSKGVLILSGFLGARYAAERQLSLWASVVFEQSCGGVEGDSASSAELYALLSAISSLPLRQSLAVTGSVNQNGRIQAIGRLNETIEGFFDACEARGLTGNQGVLIPTSNAKNLMLRADVVDAVAAGRFHVYPVETVDQGIELLTGMSAGEVDERADYPEGSVNGLVERRLTELTEQQLRFAKAVREE